MYAIISSILSGKLETDYTAGDKYFAGNFCTPLIDKNRVFLAQLTSSIG